jgi:hypothetical protein
MTSALEEFISSVMTQHFNYVKGDVYESEAFVNRCRQLDMVSKDLAATGWLCDGLAAAHISSSLQQVPTTNDKKPSEIYDCPSRHGNSGAVQDFSPVADTCATNEQHNDDLMNASVGSFDAYFDDPVLCANLSKGKKRGHWDLLA